MWGQQTFLMMALMLGLTACTPREEDRTADGRIIVSYWEKWSGIEGEAMEAVVDDFNRSQDRIFVKMLSVSEIGQKLLLAAAGGNPPDVAGLWSHSVNVYAEKGALLPIGGRLEEAEITRDDYIPVFWDLCRHRGFMWALPSTPGTIGLHWNKKLFRDAGLNPERPPQSLAELDAMAEQLTLVDVKRGKERVRIRYSELTEDEKAAKTFNLIQVGHLPGEPGWWAALWGFWFGAHLTDETGRTITADSPEQITAFRWYQSYVEKYGLKNIQQFGSGFGNFSSPQNPFLSGKVAMIIQGVWMHNFIDKYAPGLDWGAAPFPAHDPEAHPHVTLAECDILVIPRGARHPDEAFEFIRYVNTPAAMEKLCLGQRKFSPLAETSEAFLAQHPNPYIEVFIELAKSPNARHVPRLAIWNEYKSELLVAAGRISGLIAPPEDALTEVRERAQWKLDRVMRRWDAVKDARLNEWRHDDTR